MNYIRDRIALIVAMIIGAPLGMSLGHFLGNPGTVLAVIAGCILGGLAGEIDWNRRTDRRLKEAIRKFDERWGQ